MLWVLWVCLCVCVCLYLFVVSVVRSFVRSFVGWWVGYLVGCFVCVFVVCLLACLLACLFFFLCVCVFVRRSLHISTCWQLIGTCKRPEVQDIVRQLHNTHWGLVCPAETPEGQALHAERTQLTCNDIRIPDWWWTFMNDSTDVEWLWKSSNAFSWL